MFKKDSLAHLHLSTEPAKIVRMLAAVVGEARGPVDPGYGAEIQNRRVLL